MEYFWRSQGGTWLRLWLHPIKMGSEHCRFCHTPTRPKAYQPQTRCTGSPGHHSSQPMRRAVRRTQTPSLYIHRVADGSHSRARECRAGTRNRSGDICREINSLEKVNPGINPRFFSQNIAQKLLEKKMPSTQAKAMFLSIAWKSRFFSAESLIQVSSKRLYISEWILSYFFFSFFSQHALLRTVVIMKYC